MITAAHARNMKIYGATLTPCNGHSYYTTAHEAVRSAVNSWIRTPGHFDAYIDFDHTIRNPSDTTRLQAAYSNDWLHPNAAGYQLLGESIDLNLFTLSVRVTGPAEHADNAGPGVRLSRVNGTAMIAFALRREAFVSLKIYSLLGKEVSERAGRKFSSGRHTVSLENSDGAKGTYLYSFKADRFSACGIIIY